MKRRHIFWLAGVVGALPLAGCIEPHPGPDTGRVPNFPGVVLHTAYVYKFDSKQAGDDVSTQEGEYKIMNITAVESSHGAPAVRAFRVLVGPKTTATVGSDGTLIVTEGWIYLWGKWPRARTARVTACARGSAFGMYVEKDKATHVLFLGVTPTTVDKWKIDNSGFDTKTLTNAKPYIAIMHDANGIENPDVLPTSPPLLVQFVKDVKDQCEVLVGGD